VKKYFKYLLPSLITGVILLFIYFSNSLYPFYDNSIVQVDADYQYIPVMYHIYDFLHGNGNIFYSDIGLGNNIYISMIIQGSLYSPINLLLYFTSRSNIVNYFNIILLVKLCLISLTTYIYTDKSFKVSYFYKILFSVLYTFCGFILFNYFNIMWLDSVILFPLIIMYLNRLLNDGKYIGYIITLSLSLIISYYISYFILYFILFYSFTYIFFKLKRDNIKKRIFDLGKATFISILISSFSTLPAVYQMINSSRLDDSFYPDLFGNVLEKSLYILISSLFIILFIKLLFRYKKDSKNIYGYIVMFVLFIVGIFIEPINLAIHGGSCWNFPYRYGFITVFILMISGLYYIEKFSDNGRNNKYFISIILFVLLGGLGIYLNTLYVDNIIDDQIVLDFNNYKIFFDMIKIMIIIVCMYMIGLSFSNKYFRYISLGIVTLIQIFIYSSWTMYYSDGYFLSTDANKMNNGFVNLPRDGRYKMDYEVYTPDYGFILQVDTLDNWLHILPSGMVDLYNGLGYGTSDTCIRSYGGTIFSDWLLNFKYVISDRYKDESMYELIMQYDKYYLYKYKYNNNYGVLYDRDLTIDIPINDFSSFDIQNMIYRELFEDKNIISIDSYNYEDEDNIYVNYQVTEKGFLYLDTNDYENIDYILIGDEYIYFDEDYIYDLGMYDEDVFIKIKLIDNVDFNFDLGFISYSDIESLSSDIEYNDGKYYVDNVEDTDLLIPINNIDGMNVYVNDKLVDMDSYLNNFISIDLYDGDNEIRLLYKMPLFRLGIIFSIVGIILFILNKYITVNNIGLNIFYYLYIILVIIVYFYYYGYSLFRWIFV